ncbi:hypothetical protein LCGC14_1387480, partial [marine sediment metagenome]
MTVTTKREGILDYIRDTTLPLINGAGDYNLNPTLISRNVRSFDEING